MTHSRLFAHAHYSTQVIQQLLRRIREGQELSDRPGFGQPLPSEHDDALKITLAILERLWQRVEADDARLAIVIHDASAMIQEGLEAFAASHKIPLLDPPGLRGAEREGRTVRFRNDHHLTPTGQAILADDIRAFLVSEQLLAR